MLSAGALCRSREFAAVVLDAHAPQLRLWMRPTRTRGRRLERAPHAVAAEGTLLNEQREMIRG